jgi:hypothetical protein
MMNETFAIPCIGALIPRTVNGESCLLLQERRKPGIGVEDGLLELPAGKLREYENENGYTEADVVHEVGHLLDAFGLGQGAYASPTHPLLDAWRVAVNQTSAIQLLRAHQAQTHVQLQGRRIRLDQPLLEYLLRPHELFARSYAQLVAVTSGDAALRAEIGQYAAAPGKTTVYPEQWNDLDFEPVAQALDQLFLNVGWWR